MLHRPFEPAGVIGRDTENSNLQLNPQLLIHRGAHPHRVQEFALRGPCFIAVFLRVQIERRLNLCVTQDSPERFSVRLSLLQLEGSALQLESPKQLRVCSHNKSGETHRSLRMPLAIYRTLHPFTLEYLGLARALKKLCRDTGAKSGLTITFSGKDVPPHIPSDISRCLFRVAQEALQNIVRHSHARTAFIELKVRGGHALPRIVHDGVGIHNSRPKSRWSYGAHHHARACRRTRRNV